MSQVKLTLRPPPNVDFVHGYPGIPPGQDRQQAAVKGAIEIRTPAAGVKAQWVRIELRKVETLPGGGDAHTFYDYVGPSPVTLWSAPDEYNLLRTQDFPFSIRIPESIPPSIALENRAGIQYELVATVCTKGKKGFLRKRKNIVTKEIAPVLIDKHELHSTWPVYCQPETRQLTQEAVTLIVERGHTCYGPGDRIVLVATLKSENLHTIILRGFEMTLKETTIFRAQPFTAPRKAAPLSRVVTIAETKLAINATLYGGTMHQAELQCQLPENHTTTTLNAARHIDVTYVISVKALMGTGTHITMDLPLIISNWQRYISQEAIRRIGVAPALSLTPPSSSPAVMSVELTSPQRSQLQQPPQTTPLPSATHGRAPSAGQNRSNTVAAETTITNTEFGYGAGYGKGAKTGTDTKSYQNDITLSGKPGTVTSTINSSNPTERRPASGKASNPTHRFTITNAEPEFPEDQLPAKSPIPKTVASPARTTSIQKQQVQKQTQSRWPSAVDEKKAYELAKSKVEQQGVPAPSAPAPVSTPPSETLSSGASKQPWMTAAEEKALLYEKAQAAVSKAQGVSGSSGIGGIRPTASELYQQAMANVSLRNQQQTLNSPHGHISPLSGTTRKPSAAGSVTKVPQYQTAEQEKAALRRYEQARMAVDRLHNPDAPVDYDSLFSKAGGSSSSPADAPPPSFEATVGAGAGGPMTASQEKVLLAERMRAYDAAAAQQQQAQQPPVFDAVHAQNHGVSGHQDYQDAAAEKAELRRKLEEKDAAAAARKKSAKSGGVGIPPRNHSLTAGSGAGARPTPTPPNNAGVLSPGSSTNSAVLSAAEEKARVKAKFEAKDQAAAAKKKKSNPKIGVNGHPQAASPRASPLAMTTTPLPTSPQPLSRSFQHQQNAGMTSLSPSAAQAQVAPGTPPPLMPRPPQEYIQETREEDARVSKFAIDGASVKLDSESFIDGGEVGLNGNGYANGYGGQSGVVKAPGLPPPLPPKPAGE